VDFAGAWTDVSYFAEPFGGATVNAAIKLYVEGELDAHEEEAEGFATEQVVSGPSGKYQAMGEAGLSVHYRSQIPAGSGLGTSATLNVVWLSLVRREPVMNVGEKMEIAGLAYDIEKVLGIIGGKQDQYASAVGGINLFEFGEQVQRVAVGMSEGQIGELEQHLVLCYTGKPRLSSNIHRNVWGNFRAGKEETVRALFSLRDSAYEAKQYLETGKLEELAGLMTVQFEAMKKLDSSTSNEQIEELFDLAGPMIWGGKPCGAGGGGCLVFVAKSPEQGQALEEELKKRRLPVIDVEFDFEGLHMEMSPA
jgi:D-glycero-alpha-D-manno-heptose-7-phosphate kinase